MKFLDQAKIYLQSGDGGSGCMSFRRERCVEFGGPDGGNGGRGGHVIFETVKNLNTLIDFRYQQHFKAETGHHGEGRNKSGAKGNDLVIKVPIGTVILSEDKEHVLADMDKDGETTIFLKGGDGGFGNAHYKSSTNQAPRKITPGWSGEEMAIWLRLKLIADVGLLGLPNAGKSTFLAACSKAKPKIADYPFTTLTPNLGVVGVDNTEFVIADIPGLIEGAHEGLGVGHRFLGHVERTSVLLHLIDITSDSPADDYYTIRKELELYGEGLVDKPEVIALTKADSLGEELTDDQLSTFEKETGKKAYAISAISNQGVTEVLRELRMHIDGKVENIDENYVESSAGGYDPLRSNANS